MTTTTLIPLIILATVASCAVVACIVMGVLLGRRSSRISAASPWSDALVPVTASLSALAEQVQRTERENVTAQATLRTELTSQLSHHVTALTKSTDDVRREASRLNAVLGRTGARGRWGEMQLRRLVESAGMLERVHFTEQAPHQGDAGVVRPDMIINLAADRCIVVDAKVPLNAFLEAERSTDEATTNLLMKQHATDLIRHIDALQGKDYQRFVPNNCEFIVMFLPSESLLEAALDARPDLLDHAFSRNVVPATPTTLFALLRTVSLSWRQERLAQHAEEIQQLGKELHARLSTMALHFTRVGSSLDAAVAHYNKAVGSLESRVLVTARAFNDFGVTDTPLAEIPLITERVRTLSAPELTDAESDFGHAPRIELTS
ncbi:MAG: DNA recombination protein RmuC [Actinobacteria bacterium]|nr:DNA recombination protein RmuC [Actinomycetota bacterium]